MEPNASVNNRVLVVGRFPPPLDGRTVATRRLARLLESTCELRRIDISVGESKPDASDLRPRSGRNSRYFAGRNRLAASARSMPDATVLWPGISANTAGHYRDLTVVLPSLKKHRRVYGVVHPGNFHELFTSWTTRFTASYLLKHLSGLVFLNDMLRQRAATWVPAEKQIVIPNTIEESILLTKDELTAKRIARRSRSEFRLLYVGSMTPTKGWADVVRAAEILHRQDIGVRLDLVGRWESDQTREVFTDYVTQRGLSPVIIHHGPVSDRGEIKAFYAQADAFVLPTYYPAEAQPLTIIEALNAGTPLITTRHAGIPEMIDEGVEGYFVGIRQPEAIAGAVQRMLDVETWADLSIAARKRFERQFAPDIVREMWLKLSG